MAGEAAASGLRFFLDRGLGSKIVPGLLREAGWVLETMDERYGTAWSQKIEDIQWIAQATANGEVLLCKDLKIARNPLEAQVVYMNHARAFGLSNRHLPGPTMAEWYLTHEVHIVEMATRAEGPYVVAVNPTTGLRRVRLNYPPG